MDQIDLDPVEEVNSAGDEIIAVQMAPKGHVAVDRCNNNMLQGLNVINVMKLDIW